MGILRFLFYFLLFYFIYRIIRFLIFPPRRKNTGFSGYNQRDHQRKKEGETTINHIPNEKESNVKSKSSKDDYIDYEEVE